MKMIQNRTSIHPIVQMNGHFVGTKYMLAYNWLSLIDVNDYKDTPIRYLEIGTFYGANLFSVAQTYGSHSDSQLYCIDPWEDYTEYPEYKTEQTTVYDTFMQNVENSGMKEKITIRRGYSNREIPYFPDNFFDIIYIDGNHEPNYVLEDAVLSFRKLKSNGILIFDDYGWGGPNLTQKGIDGFLSAYSKKYRFIGERITQIFLRKI